MVSKAIQISKFEKIFVDLDLFLKLVALATKKKLVDTLTKTF